MAVWRVLFSLVPFIMGGRHPFGQLVLTALAAVMSLAWTAHLCCSENAGWRPSRATAILLAGAALVLLQITPLPQSLLAWLAPGRSELLPLWHGGNGPDVGVGAWPYLSLAPAETRAGLAIFLAYALIFLVTVQRIEAVEDVERLLRWCAASAVGMAAFALVQLLCNNGKFFWFYEPFQSNISNATTGAFHNRNHFAQFLALGIGPLIWWLQDAIQQKRSHRRGERHHGERVVHSPSAHRSGGGSGAFEEVEQSRKGYYLGLLLGVVLFAGLLSLSRGGIIAITTAAMLSIVVCFCLTSFNKKLLAMFAGTALLAGASLAIFGYDIVSKRLETVSSGSLEQLDGGFGRLGIWGATLQGIPHHLPLGSGIGSFVDVHPTHADMNRWEVEFSHGENCYLPVALEGGAVGFVLLVAGVVLCGWWCFRGMLPGSPNRLRLCAGMIAASLVASAVHALVDFIWYVPACAAMLAVLAACAQRIQQLADQGQATPSFRCLPKFLPITAVPLLVVLGGWMVVTTIEPTAAAESWNQCRFVLGRLDGLAKGSPSNKSSKSEGETQGVEAERRLIALLDDVVARQPTHPRGHLQLVDAHLRLFERLQAESDNPMSLANIRDAVRQSQFSSGQALREWLSRAFGENWKHLEKAMHHAKQAIALCPLHGRAYVYLAELSFLR